MQATNADGNIAVLIDADNVSHKIIAGLMAEVVRYGNASVRRIYGDWTSPLMKGWRECLLEHSIIPIQQFAYTTGKNATDGAMIIDAMDLLYTGRFSAFCLVSSDSDFTRLAARIREQGMPVYGFGNRHNTHKAFVAACNEFVYLDALPAVAHESQENQSSPPAQPFTLPSRDPGSEPPTAAGLSTTSPAHLASADPSALTRSQDLHQRAPVSSIFQSQGFRPFNRTIDAFAKDALRKAVSISYQDGDYANLAKVGEVLKKISPDLTPRNYGFLQLKDFAEASGIVELRMKSRDRGPPIAFVRLKD